MHGERLHKQWVIKQKQKLEPIVAMTKVEVESKRLKNHVLHDNEDMETFSVWWKALSSDEEVEVQYPHERHELPGRY